MQENKFNLSNFGDTDTVAIVDYKMLNNGLARVVVSFTGQPSKTKIKAKVAEMTGNRAAIVENSFRLVAKNAAAGYIRANQEIRQVDEKEIRANYVTASANILMSNEDNSLWAVKKVGDSTYLAKQDDEDLDDVVEAVLSRSAIQAPRLMALASVKPEKHDLVAFVTDQGDMAYGFVTSANSKACKVMANCSKKPMIVANDQIVSSSQVEIDAATDKAVRQKVLAANKSTMVDYYSELFSYDQQYLNQVIDMINDMSFA